LTHAADSDRPSPVTVQILDKDYRIACSPEEQHGLMDCARMLDQRMREVRQNGRVIGADRIAVMAALNLIYDLTRQRDQNVLENKRLLMLQERIGKALEAQPAAGRRGAAANVDSAAATDPKSGLDASGDSV
jgi:cell division protein ZapA